MNVDKVKVHFGILGCSRVAGRRMLPAMSRSERVTITRIGSRSVERATAWCEEHGCERAGSYEDVLADPDVEAVYISLPPSLHERWAVRAAGTGKHVLCEKPASLSLASAGRMVEAAVEADVGLMEAYMFRFHPQHARVREMMDAGTLGTIHHFSGRFGYPIPGSENIRLDPNLGGGVFNDAAGYPLYASRMLFDEEPQSASAIFVKNAEYGVDERAEILLRFPSGRTGFLAVGFDLYFQSRYSVWGSEARVTLGRAYAVPPDRGTRLFLDHDDVIKTEEIGAADQFRLMIEAFCEGLSTADFGGWHSDMVAQARAMEAARISWEERRTVDLEELKEGGNE